MRQKAFIFFQKSQCPQGFYIAQLLLQKLCECLLVGVQTAHDIMTFISYYHVLYAVCSLKRITEDGIHLSITNYFEENKPSYYSKLQTSNPLSSERLLKNFP